MTYDMYKKNSVTAKLLLKKQNLRDHTDKINFLFFFSFTYNHFILQLLQYLLVTYFTAVLIGNDELLFIKSVSQSILSLRFYFQKNNTYNLVPTYRLWCREYLHNTHNGKKNKNFSIHVEI